MEKKTEQERIETIKAEIRKGIKRYQNIPTKTGGQSCGIPSYPMILESPEMDFKIEIGYHRSQLKNWELCSLMFELYMDDLIK